MINEISAVRAAFLLVIVSCFWFIIAVAATAQMLMHFDVFTNSVKPLFYTGCFFWLVFCFWNTYRLLKKEEIYPRNIKPPVLDVKK